MIDVDNCSTEYQCRKCGMEISITHDHEMAGRPEEFHACGK